MVKNEEIRMSGKFTDDQIFHLFHAFPNLLAAGNCHMKNSNQWTVRKSNSGGRSKSVKYDYNLLVGFLGLEWNFTMLPFLSINFKIY